MLSFVEALKQIIDNVQTTGGAVIERSFPSPSLVQRLRGVTIFFRGKHTLSGASGKYDII